MTSLKVAMPTTRELQDTPKLFLTLYDSQKKTKNLQYLHGSTTAWVDVTKFIITLKYVRKDQFNSANIFANNDP